MTPPSRTQAIQPPSRTQAIQPPTTKQSKTKIQFSSIGESKGQRVLLYGTGGIGKSTLACLAGDKVVFYDLDESLSTLKKQLKENDIPLPRIAPSADWASIRASLQSDGWTDETIIIDTVTKLEEMAVAHTLKFTKKEGGKTADGVEDYGYGKGYQHVFDTFLPILGDLDCHIRAGRNVILIAHECTTKVPNPNGEDWLRYEPRLQSASSGKASIRYRLKEWSDHVLFLNYDVVAEKKTAKGSGRGTRTLYTSEVPAFMAKSRTTTQSFNIEHGVSPWEEILK